MFLRTMRNALRIVLNAGANVTLSGYEYIPREGGAIVVTNHIGRLDAILGVILADRDDIILMIADKYQSVPFWRWTGDKLDAIWLDREEADFHALREVFRRLKDGGILGIAPEGTRSKSEALAPGKPGAAYLAARSGVPIIPVGLSGTEDRVVKQRLKHMQRLNIGIRIGEPFTLPPLPRKDRDAFLAQSTDEIMCRIAALLPPAYRGFYADYPRVAELVAQQALLEA
ncbi:MAG: lysophospholipid acyltransferase family protein [Candidatus Promineifilaceae bacterium]